MHEAGHGERGTCTRTPARFCRPNAGKHLIESGWLFVPDTGGGLVYLALPEIKTIQGNPCTEEKDTGV